MSDCLSKFHIEPVLPAFFGVFEVFKATVFDVIITDIQMPAHSDARTTQGRPTSMDSIFASHSNELAHFCLYSERGQ